MNKNCLHFKAKVKNKNALLFTALIRSVEDNMMFDRGILLQKEMYEFFVPIEQKNIFIFYLELFKSNNLIENWNEEILKS